MTTTHLLYLEDFTTLSCEAKVIELFKENENDIVILDQTIFYPQGGGQPYDQGFIESDTGQFAVEEVRLVDDVVKHIGKFNSKTFNIYNKVSCHVNAERRTLHSRIHSAGHVIDLAVQALGLPWTPGKGYHFPQGPYVEYSGSLQGFDKDKLKMDLENLCNQFIQQDINTKLAFVSKEQLHTVCTFLPDFIPENNLIRVVLFGNFGVPCGGTHIKKLSELKSMTVRKIKLERGNIRVSYDVAR